MSDPRGCGVPGADLVVPVCGNGVQGRLPVGLRLETKGIFRGPALSEAIVYASDSALRRLTADPPEQCRTLRLSDGRSSWTTRYHRITLPNPPTGQTVAYRLEDESGANPTTWVALTRDGDYLIEVRLLMLPLSDDVAGQQAMLDDLIRQAHAMAASTLRWVRPSGTSSPGQGSPG